MADKSIPTIQQLAGNVGIGTSSPQTKLDVIGDTFVKGVIFGYAGSGGNQVGGITWDSTDDGILFLKASNVTKVSINSNGVSYFNGGNVGIGSTSPTQKLDVNGNILTNSTLYAGSTASTRITVDGGSIAGYYSSEGNARFLIGRDIYTSGQSGIALGGGGSFIMIGDASGTVGTAMAFAVGASNGGGPSAEKMRINSNGNVGIGTTSPGTKTEIYRVEGTNRTTYTDLLTITAAANTNPYSGHGGGILFKGTTYRSGTGTYDWGRIGMTLTDNSVITTGQNMFFDVAAADNSSTLTTAMTIQYNGNVGIGSTSPAFKLETIGNTRISGNLSVGTTYNGFPANIEGVVYVINGSVWVNDGNGYANASATTTGMFPDSGNNITFKTNNSTRIYVTSGGNVGIGTTSPAYTLDVNGSFRTSGRQFINGLTTLAYKIKYSELSIGGTITDADASDGTATYINSASGSTFFFGPYTSITPGEYIASFRMKVASNSSTSQLGQIDIIGTNTTGSAIIITPSMFETSNRYQYIDIPFTVNGSASSIEFRGVGFNPGITTTYLDHVLIRPLAKNYTQLIPSGKNYNIYYNGVGTPRLTIDTGGNVGIGTTSPSFKLEVVETNNSATSYPLSVTNNNNQAGDGYGAGIKFSTSNPSLGGNEANKWSSIEAFDVNNYGSNSGLSFTVSNAYTKIKALVINRSGGVGIGTTNPTENLTIYSAGAKMSVTGPSGASAILMGNQDSGGVNNPAAIYAANGGLYFGGGTSWSGGGTLSANVTFEDGGFVGIGTTSPAFKLDVSGNVRITDSGTSGGQMQLGSMAVQYPYNRVDSYSHDGTGYFWGFGRRTGATQQINAFFVGTARDFNAADGINVITWTANEFNQNYPSYTTSARIAASGASYFNGGNVGIGTTSPSAKFNVNNNGSTGNAFYVDAGNTPGNQVLFEHSGANTPVPFTIKKSGYSGASDNFGILYLDMAHSVAGGGSNLYFTLRDSGGGLQEYGGLGAVIVTNTAGSMAGALNFYTTNAGTTRQIRMRIAADGNVGIGTTSPGYKLDVNGEIGLPGTIRLTNGGGTITYISEAYGINLNGDATHPIQVNATLLVGYNASGGNYGTNNAYIAGTVGIGTTSPGTKTEIYRLEGTNRTTYTDLLTINAAANTSPYAGHGGGILFKGTTYIGNYNWGRIGMELTDFSEQRTGENMFFEVAAADNSSTLTRAMTIQYNGNVGIGTTSPAYKLDVNGDIRINPGLTMVAATNSLYATDGTLSYYSSTNGVYLNGAGTNGWLRLNASGVENYQNCIDIYGSAGARIEFRTGNTERMRITAAGSIGIGTTSPSYKLQVYDTTSLTSINAYNYKGSSGGTSAVILGLNDGTFTTADAARMEARIITNPNAALDFKVYGSGLNTIMTLLGTGNVGIGTTAPVGLLEVGISGSSLASGNIVSWGQSERYERKRGATFSSGLIYKAFNKSSTTLFPSPATEEAFTGGIRSYSGTVRGIGVTANISNFTFSVDFYYVEFFGLIYIDTAKVYYFDTNSDDASDLFIDGKRVADYYGGHGASGGGNKGGIYLNVGYHKFYARYEEQGGGDSDTVSWSTDGGSTYVTIPSSVLYHDPNDIIRSDASANVYFLADVVAYSTSDIRLKENITPLSTPLDKLMKLQGVDFTWKQDIDTEYAGKKDIGLIAQQVEEVLPDAVETRYNGYKAVRYEKVIPLLIEAIKEQQRQIDDLKYLLQTINK